MCPKAAVNYVFSKKKFVKKTAKIPHGIGFRVFFSGKVSVLGMQGFVD
jgi:hypothetical protein